MRVNNNYSVTVMTCHDKGARATKKFIKHENGKTEKIGYKAGKYFTWKEYKALNLNDLVSIIEDVVNDPRKFIIRGKIKSGINKEVVRRKLHGDDAAFDSVPRPYVMFDFDKVPCPDFFDVSVEPEQGIKWILDMLPQCFKDVDCYYQYSASQNVAVNDVAHKITISAHLWFFLDREVSDDEWKRYLKSVDTPIDPSLFTAVQPHYVAKPIFMNMDDPLPNRSGLLKGNSDFVAVPNIPESEKRQASQRATVEPIVTEDDKQQAIEKLSEYYSDGSRNRFAAAIAAVLYRGGWHSENAADFILELAEQNNDQEAEERYKNSLKICDTIDSGLSAPGIPTLKKEFSITNLENLLKLLGVGKKDLDELILRVDSSTSQNELEKVMSVLANCSETEQNLYIHKLKEKTKLTIKVLQSMLNEAIRRDSAFSLVGWADAVVNLYLNGVHRNGRNFIRSTDKRYWQYNGWHWEYMPDDMVKKGIIDCAREVIAINELKHCVSSITNAALNILEGEAFVDGDPLGLRNKNMPSVVNCQNGTLWFDETGLATLKPHRSGDYLRYCLDVEYDPNATCSMFDKAVLDIFSASSDPEGMVRHFMELAGYVCQTWRKIPLIVLLYGHGGNGKSTLMKIISRILTEKMILSGRISDIWKDKFKIGHLDGKLLVFEDDVKSSTKIDDGFLKMISEEKLMTGEQKYKDPFEFLCRALPFMSANTFPYVDDLSHGFVRRAMVIPFDRRFTEKDRDLDLLERIWSQEKSGILNRFVKGFGRLRSRGGFDEPEDCVQAKMKWISRSNTLSAFIKDKCNVGPEHKQTLREFHQEYSSYCAQYDIEIIQRHQWVRGKLEDMEFEISEVNGEPMVRGICAQKSPFSHVKID